MIIALFIFVGMAYFWPNFEHKNHSESDMSQHKTATTEIDKYREKDGKNPNWTNAIFSGMPTQIMVGKTSKSVIVKLNYLTPFESWTKYPFEIILLNMLGFYILLLCFGVDKWLAAGGAIAYSLATYSISSIEAAHYTKVLAMGMMPAVIGGFYLLIQKKYLMGLFVLAFHFAIQSHFVHYQITYYTMLSILVFGLGFAVHAVKAKEFKHLMLVILLSLTGFSLGLVTDLGQLRSTYSYSAQSMRGGSELADSNPTEPNKQGNTVTKNGLDIEYAFRWSYGISESFTALIPGFSGGSNQEKTSKRSAMYKHLLANGVPAADANRIVTQGLPLYHGSMPMTSGPVYFGAILIFLFVLGTIIIKDWIKWPLIALVVFSFFLAWGRHLGFLNNFLFEYLPMYNKFRTPMMSLSIAQVALPLMGLLAFHRLLVDPRPFTKKMENLKLAFYITGGIVVVFGILFSFFYDFAAEGDKQITQTVITDGLMLQRESMLRFDAFRSLVFISLCFGLIWALFKKKIEKPAFYAAFIVLMVLDLGGIAKRYLPWEEFKYKDSLVDADMEPTASDKMILQDKDLHYRVFDLARDPFNDNTSAKFHKLIGGYSPAKMSRYQDLISNQIAKNNEKVLDMLNCKYIIGRNKETEQELSQMRPTAYGNAWFVSDLKWVRSPKQEMDALTSLDPRTTAVADKKFEKALRWKQVPPPDSLDEIKLLSYHPDTMIYESNSKNGGLAVFSEIYYQPGWQAFIDDMPFDHGRVNYVLRAMQLPSGKHRVKFIWEDKEAKTDHTVELTSSIAIVLLLPLSLLFYFRRKEDEPKK
jgi:hypothetical protein